MKKSKEERSAFAKSLGEVTRQIFFPAIIIGCVMLVHNFFPGFWIEIITVFCATGISLVVTNFTEFEDDDHNDRHVLRDLIILLTGTIFWIYLVTVNNTSPNYFYPILGVLSVVLIIIGLIILFNVGFRTYESRDEDGKHYSYYSGISKLIALFLTVVLLGEIYIHFGTQFVWLPAIILFVFYPFLYRNEDVNRFLSRHPKDGVDGLIVFGPPALALISTLYQFWFAQIFGYSLWIILSWAGGLGLMVLIAYWITKDSDLSFWRFLISLILLGAIIVALCKFWFTVILGVVTVWQIFAVLATVAVIISICYRVIERKKAKKLEEEESKERGVRIEAERKQAEEVHANKLNILNSAIKSITEASEVLWQDIFIVIEYYGHDMNNYLEIIPKFFTAPLIQLVVVSEVKRQIVWSSQFTTALILLEKIAVKTYKDEALNLLIKQLTDFISYLDKYKEYETYPNVIQHIKNNCPKLYELLTKEKVA